MEFFTSHREMMKELKEDRSKEMVLLKEERTKELDMFKEERTRELDMFKELLETGVKTEVAKQVEPLVTKQTSMEETQNELLRRMDLLAIELSKLKENIPEAFPPSRPPPSFSATPTSEAAPTTETEESLIKEIVAKARRTLGLRPSTKMTLKELGLKVELKTKKR